MTRYEMQQRFELVMGLLIGLILVAPVLTLAFVSKDIEHKIILYKAPVAATRVACRVAPVVDEGWLVSNKQYATDASRTGTSLSQ